MKNGGRRVVRGETHCDTVGDFFKNPILFKIVKEYYKSQNIDKVGKKLRKNRGFTPEFYEFIREIFSNADEMEKFLLKIRNEYVGDRESWERIKKEYNEGLVEVLLAFEHIHISLKRPRTTVGAIFSDDIRNIISTAQVRPLLSEEICENERIEYQLFDYYGIEEVIKRGIFPISANGEIICLLDKINKDAFRVVELGTENIFHVNKHGTCLGDTTKVVTLCENYN